MEISREKHLCCGLFLMNLPALVSESLLKRDYFDTFRRFSVNSLNNFEYFFSVIIINFIFYDFPSVMFVGFLGGILISFFKVLLKVFSDIILFTLFIRLY